jgi:hypothetical protein
MIKFFLLLITLTVTLAKGPAVTSTLVMTIGQGGKELGTIKLGNLFT